MLDFGAKDSEIEHTKSGFVAKVANIFSNFLFHTAE
jgi:hypothetical protein